MFTKLSGFIVVLILTGCNIYKESKIPPIELTKPGNFSEKVLSVLDYDSNDLIVATSIGNNYSQKFTTYYLVFHQNKRVTFYDSKSRIGNPVDSLFEKTILSKKKSKPFFDLITTHYESSSFSINSDSLNITSKTTPNAEGLIENLSVSDGSYYDFWMLKSNKISVFSSYSPNSYIQGGFPGRNDRQKLLNLINSFGNLIKKLGN